VYNNLSRSSTLFELYDYWCAVVKCLLLLQGVLCIKTDDCGVGVQVPCACGYLRLVSGQPAMEFFMGCKDTVLCCLGVVWAQRLQLFWRMLLCTVGRHMAPTACTGAVA
jgi:hypothetical protein